MHNGQPRAGHPESAASLSFTIDCNARGFWVARERSGLIEGVFPTQGEAIRFALIELGRSSARARLPRAA